ncbi:MAG: hypothetical protein R2708_23130 [Vicinamibacterales bacterium]
MKIGPHRAMIRAALSGQLDHVAYERIGLQRGRADDHPACRPACSAARHLGDPAHRLDAQAKKLAQMFIDNFRTFAGDVDAAVVAAGPRV